MASNDLLSINTAFCHKLYNIAALLQFVLPNVFAQKIIWRPVATFRLSFVCCNMARPIVLSGWRASYDRRGGSSKWIGSAICLKDAITFWCNEPREFHLQGKRGRLKKEKKSSDNLWYTHSTFSGYMEKIRQLCSGLHQDRIIHRLGNIQDSLGIFIRWTDIWSASIVVQASTAPPTIRLAPVRWRNI